eukprot:scaffold64896_cov33-Tisochrysis_lutea.AAC.5
MAQKRLSMITLCAIHKDSHGRHPALGASPSSVRGSSARQTQALGCTTYLFVEPVDATMPQGRLRRSSMSKNAVCYKQTRNTVSP